MKGSIELYHNKMSTHKKLFGTEEGLLSILQNFKMYDNNFYVFNSDLVYWIPHHNGLQNAPT